MYHYFTELLCATFPWQVHVAVPSTVLNGQLQTVECLLFLWLMARGCLHLLLSLSHVGSVLEEDLHHLRPPFGAGQHQGSVLVEQEEEIVGREECPQVF